MVQCFADGAANPGPAFVDQRNLNRSVRKDDLRTGGHFNARWQQHHTSYDHSCDSLLEPDGTPGRIAFLNGGEPRFLDLYEMIQHLQR